MKLGLLLGLLLTLTEARAFSGNDLWDAAQDPQGQHIFTAYIRGVGDASALFQGATRVVDGKAVSAKTICMPDGSTYIQAGDIVKIELRDNPKDRHLPAVFHVYRALANAWPCR